LKVVHLSHTDAGAGAGGAAYRIHTGLLRLTVNSRMFVAQKRTTDPTVQEVSDVGLKKFGVLCAEYLESRTSRMLVRERSALFSSMRFAWYKPWSSAIVREADVVALYWINGAFISPEALSAVDNPIVWRLSDVWPFTGGCHYPGACRGFERACGQCPQLKQPSKKDVSSRLLMRKADLWRALNLTVVAPSHWMADLARRSTLFADRRIEVIPTGVDLDRYCPGDRAAARNQLCLPQDRLLILCGAINLQGDRRKGYIQLKQALDVVASSPLGNRVLVVLFGTNQLLPNDLPLPVVSLGLLHGDEALAAAYNSADVVVVPSLEDNLPNVAIEAIACGVPVVAFDVGGMRDIVADGWNGRLIPEEDSEALGKGLVQVLLDTKNLRVMRLNARQRAQERFSLNNQVRSYLSLYEQVVSKNNERRRILR
jgi:glycosyltransferase involved in cell wall biosynthesis